MALGNRSAALYTLLPISLPNDSKRSDVNQDSLVKPYKIDGAFINVSPYSTETIPKWLIKIYGKYIGEESGHSGSWCYVTAGKLYENGILKEIITPNIKNIILIVKPNTVMFHSHAYSIPPNARHNHIGYLEQDGWHRAFIKPAMVSKTGCRAFSMFIYLLMLWMKQTAFLSYCPNTLIAKK